MNRVLFLLHLFPFVMMRNSFCWFIVSWLWHPTSHQSAEQPYSASSPADNPPVTDTWGDNCFTTLLSCHVSRATVRVDLQEM